MAAITLSNKASFDVTNAVTGFAIRTLPAGEAIAAGQPLCAGNGSYWPLGSNNAPSATRDFFVGCAPVARVTGQPVTPQTIGARFRASEANLVPGAIYYAGDDGTIHDAATAIDVYGAFLADGNNDLVIIKLGKLTAPA